MIKRSEPAGRSARLKQIHKSDVQHVENEKRRGRERK